MNSKIKLSILILTYNEERYIGKLLQSLNFTNEVIVLDSFSTDKTVEIVQSFSQVKLIQNKFKDYANQRNLAIKHATNDWVLFLDADELLTPELETEIKSLIELTPKSVAYKIPRVFMFKDKPVHFTGTQNDFVQRLFNKNHCAYLSDKLVHEKLEVNGQEDKLKNKMIHYTYYDYEVFKRKVISYGKLKAKEKHEKGKKYNIILHFFHPAYTFLSYYILKLGFLDGIKGVILSYLFSYSVHARYSELKRLQS